MTLGAFIVLPLVLNFKIPICTWMTMVPVVPITWKVFASFFYFYKWEINGNAGDVAYSLPIVKMSNNKHHFTSLIFPKQHFHHILHLNSIVRGKIAFPKPRSNVFIFVAMSIMSCDIIDQYFPHSRLSTKIYTMGKKHCGTLTCQS